MVKEVSIQKVREDAEELFRTGGFYCSEALVASVRKNLDPEMPEAMISAASGFPVGVGRSKCMCGAVSGGVICMGYFLGAACPAARRTKKAKTP
ncbi:MAG: C-GCAxxG-C-C family (seleno)protein [Oscillospiraceae bacterium]